MDPIATGPLLTLVAICALGAYGIYNLAIRMEGLVNAPAPVGVSLIARNIKAYQSPGKDNPITVDGGRPAYFDYPRDKDGFIRPSTSRRDIRDLETGELLPLASVDRVLIEASEDEAEEAEV